MAEPLWRRSLYWRIALGFVALLATVLVLQGFVFLWMTGRMADFFPSRSPAQFAASLAADVGTALAEHPDFDLSAYVNGLYARSSRAFVVVLSDGRTATSARVRPPAGFVPAADFRLQILRNGRRPWGRGLVPPAPDGRPGGREMRLPPGVARGDGRTGRSGRGSGGPFGPGGPAVEFAPITVGGETAGMVAVAVQPPPLMTTLRDLGPTLAAVALALLVAATSIGALVIFRPVRRRLRDLQEAARAIGAGRTGVRAPVTGGDEVTSLSRAFNEMAAELEQRTVALEHADRVRRQLFADVSHELGTPLAAIRGYVETLQMDDVRIGADARRRYLGIVEEETARLEHIVGDLLDLARLEGDGLALHVDRVPLDHLFARIADRHGPALGEKQITLRAERDPQIVAIEADPNRLEQALQNLVANAIRHTPAGGEVRVCASGSPDAVTITVEDSGPGIPAEHLERVFDRFYKVDQSRSGAGASGSGLGLSIVRAIVARHGGTIRASNRPEGGARFEMSLPRLVGHSPTHDPGAKPVS